VLAFWGMMVCRYDVALRMESKTLFLIEGLGYQGRGDLRLEMVP